ncbi:MAG: hypothetical protein RMI49_03985 [Candidatus Caldarchaeum sp.]|nr:hypothetical protein [Candidatus Caldarchaeum sp.]
MESVLYDVSFWLLVNFFLIAAIVGLVLVRQSMTKTSAKPAPTPEIKKLDEEIMLFKSLTREGALKEAVSSVFPRVYRKACSSLGLDSKGYTVRDVLNSGKLPPKILRLLSTMYQIYEPVRFGGVEVSRANLAVFAETLEKLNSELSSHD